MNTHPIVITGAAGVIGRALATHLRSRGYAVRGVDIRSAGDEHVDVRDVARLRDAVAGAAGVIHLAAVARVRDAEQTPDECNEINVQGTANALAAVRQSAPGAWVLLASSREVFGQPRALPACSLTPIAPINRYGISKAAAERVCRESNVRTGVLRLANVYGAAGDYAEQVIPAFVDAALSGRDLRVHGAEKSLDFVHIDDVVAAFDLAIQRLSRHEWFAPVLVCSGEECRLAELAHYVVEQAGTASSVVVDPTRPGEVDRFVGDPTDAAVHLSWAALTGWREGVLGMLKPTSESGRVESTTAVGDHSRGPVGSGIDLDDLT